MNSTDNGTRGTQEGGTPSIQETDTTDIQETATPRHDRDCRGGIGVRTSTYMSTEIAQANECNFTMGTYVGTK